MTGRRHPARRPDHPIRVLHLEDSARDAHMIADKLEADGVWCEIVPANSRESFDAALARDAYDVILCDYNLPGYDGFSALTRAKDVQPQAPVIIISGTVGEEEAVRCVHAGATDYLLKQRLERLAPAVERAIEEAAERRRRKRAEEALQERERHLSSIFEAVADMLFYVAVEPGDTYRLVSVNPAFLTRTGLELAEVIGKRIEEVSPDPGVTLWHYAQAIRERRIVRWEESSDVPNGHLIGEVSVTPVFDAAGRCTHLVGAVRDVTERRQLEAQLRQAQKMESVGQLAGGIAHDFNNLLTVINGMAELVLTQVADSNRQIQSDVQEIQRAGERAAALTRQLLAFSRKQVLKPEVMDLNVVVSDLANMLRRLLGEDVHLVVEAGDDPAHINADRGQIEQVVANLSVNARDAMPAGGILTIGTRRVDLDTPLIHEGRVAVEPGSYVVLTVNDTGTGIDDATRRHMFEPFFTTKGPGKGTGLGLSTVYGIVQQSGGCITVDSTPGAGTRFSIYLPSVDSGERIKGSSAAPFSGRGSETILLVEDVVGLRRLMTRSLESSGYTVLAAAGGDEALRVLGAYEGPVHLTVTDVVMPGMSGRELAERLQQTRPGMRVVYMSGYTDDVTIRHGVSEHKVAFVSKPFAAADLVRTIRQTLDAPGGAPDAHHHQR